MFITQDSMILLGMAFIVSVLGAYLLPVPLAIFREGTDAPKSLSGPKRRSRLLTAGVAFSAVVLMVLVLYWTNRHVLNSFLSSADEHSCYFLAECLRKGKLFVDLPLQADFFKVVHVGMRGGKWFSVYPLGWPLIWAMGLNLRIVDWLNPAMSAMSLFFFYLAGIRLFSRASVMAGLSVCVVSPFFLFTAASYFSHATCLLCIAVFLYAFLRWRESYLANTDAPGWAAIWSFAFGYGLMTRYLTMAAVAGPFLVWHYFPIVFEWKILGNVSFGKWKLALPALSVRRFRLSKSDRVALVVLGVFGAIILWQNYRVSGNFLKAPNRYDKSYERLGFRGNYTPLDALLALIARVFYLMDWFSPPVVGVYLWLLLSKAPRHFSEILHGRGAAFSAQRLFYLVPVFLALAYSFYYSWGGNQWGPRYLWESAPFLSLTVIHWLAGYFRSGTPFLRKFVLIFFVTSIAASCVLMARHASETSIASRERRALYDLAGRAIAKPSVVFIRGNLGRELILSEDDAVRNSPFLDGRILYAHDRGEQNTDLMAMYPDRQFFRGTYDPVKNKPVLELLSK